MPPDNNNIKVKVGTLSSDPSTSLLANQAPQETTVFIIPEVRMKSGIGSGGF